MKKILSCLLSLIMILLFSGCGKEGPTVAEKNEESVKLSNIMFQGMEMSQEQEEMLKAVITVLESAIIDGEGNLSAINTTGKTLSIRFLTIFYESDTKLNGKSTITLDEWLPESAINITLNGRPNEYQNVKLAAEIELGDKYLRTGFVPKAAPSDDNSGIVVLAHDLPIRVSTDDSVYLITEYFYGNTNTFSSISGLPYYQGTLLLTKEFGSGNTSEEIGYKIINNSTQAVADSGFMRLIGLEVGDVARIPIGTGYAELEPGSYTLELSAKSITSA